MAQTHTLERPLTAPPGAPGASHEPPVVIDDLVARAHVATRYGPAPYGPPRYGPKAYGEDRPGTKRR